MGSAEMMGVKGRSDVIYSCQEATEAHTQCLTGKIAQWCICFCSELPAAGTVE